ncbi:copper chaperone PCu(A)C [Gemmatimonas sp.]
MQGLFRRTRLALLCSVAAGCDLSPPIDVEQAVLVLPAASGSASATNPYALYFSLHNRGNADVAVSAVTVDSAGSAQLQSVTAHRMPNSSDAPGMPALMQAVERVEVPKHSRVTFAPGGFTVTVLPGNRAWRVGDSVAFTVQLASAWTVSGRARVATFAELDDASAPGAGTVSDSSGIDSASADSASADSATAIASAVATGQRLYRANGCAQCHGVEGSGDGPLAKVLQPPPRNFRAALPFANGGTPDAIARTLATGLSAGGSMPLYPHLSRQERLAIASYVLSLGTQRPTPTTGSPPRSIP